MNLEPLSECPLEATELGVRRMKADAFIDDAKINELVLRRVSDHAHRFAALLHSFDLLSEKFSQLDDAFITDAEMLRWHGR